jgi:hypothetical protein
LSASPTQITEGRNAKYVIRASSAVAQATTVNYSMSGTATLGADYTLSGTPGRATIAVHKSSVQVELKAKRDNATEGSETAIMTLRPGSGYELGSPSQATVTISDN